MSAEKVPKKPKEAPKPVSDRTTNDLVEDLVRSMLLSAADSHDVETKLKVAKHAMQWEAIKVKTSMANKWGADLMGDEPDPFTEEEKDD